MYRSPMFPFIAVVFFAILMSAAASEGTTDEREYWTPFQLSATVGYGQIFSEQSTVTGLRIGLLSSENKHLYGLDVSLLFTGIKESVTGIQISIGNGPGRPPLCSSTPQRMTGVQVSLSNEVRGSAIGLQIGGLCNICRLPDEELGLYGLQVAGLFNRAQRHMYGIQLGGLYNWSQMDTKGIQFSPVNVIDGRAICLQVGGVNYYNTIKKEDDCLVGLQLGAWNYARRMKGLQVGVINYCEELYGIQIGVFNIIKQSPVPLVPIINVRF